MDNIDNMEVINTDTDDVEASKGYDNTVTTIHPIIPVFKRCRDADIENIGFSYKPTGRHQQRKSVDDSAMKSVTLPPLQRSVTDLGGLRTMYKKPKSPTPNFTMINRRDPNLMKTPNVNSLITISKPIPNLLDRPKKENKEEAPKRNLSIWKNEVKKVVPSRPAIAINSDWKAPPADWDDRDQYIYGPKPIFYKNNKYPEHKDFVVNPEWLSEFMTVSTYSQAYRTCALRYGWCA
ncbi:uncharacterized protein LOC132714299 isoform X2 [Ruditapes philippinarum]|uniref:uncharacterized protein LOC132714299 isoform X2 n=1 Tax=Ruditapes philippinarum TaxID=129788 RepID=UPI00295B0499|nr:uncharacterized protein LOC132714299 isoform X2 [Ruditapes philippinarum]